MNGLPSSTEFLIRLLIAWFIAAPLCSFLHELGHAIAALRLTKQNVAIELGQRGPSGDIQLGRLRIVLHLEPGLLFGRILLDDWETVPDRQNMWIYLGGPIVTLLLMVVFAMLGVLTNWASPWPMFTTINTIIVLFSVIPWALPGWFTSDTLQAWRFSRHSQK